MYAILIKILILNFQENSNNNNNNKFNHIYIKKMAHKKQKR